MTDTIAQRILTGIRGKLGTGTMGLAAHSAIPVAMTPILVNLIRNRYFVDPPETLPFSVEAELLLSPLFRSIGPDLYEMDPDLRELLLGELDVRYGPGRARDVAELLLQYSMSTPAWRDLPRLDAAQRFTSYGFIDPVGADEALRQATRFGPRMEDDPSWRVAMRTQLARASDAAPSRAFDQAVAAAQSGDWDTFVGAVARGLERLPAGILPVAEAQLLLSVVRRIPEARPAHRHQLFTEISRALDLAARASPGSSRELATSAFAFAEAASLPGSVADELQRAVQVLDELAARDGVRRTNRASWAVEQTGAPLVWSEFGTNGAGVRVAVLATGVQGDHPDLTGKVAAWRDFATDDPDPSAEPAGSTDVQGHGTYVASLVAGGDASGEAIGMAPGARLLAPAVLRSDGSGSTSTILSGLEWAAEQSADVIVLPLGSESTKVEPAYTGGFEMLNEKGVVVICAVGNSGPGSIYSPANQPLAIAVGATDRRDEVASFSGGGTMTQSGDVIVKPDLVAPGVAVPGAKNDGGWQTINGTSSSVGIVGGAVALLLSSTSIRQQTSGRERTEVVRQCLYASANRRRPDKDSVYGWGVVDAYAAIREAWTLGYAPQSPSSVGSPKVIVVRGSSKDRNAGLRETWSQAGHEQGATVVYLGEGLVATVYEVVEYLFYSIGTDSTHMPPRDVSASAWNRMASNRLAADLRQLGRPLWVAVDDLGLTPDGVPLLDPQIREFFDQLALQLLDPAVGRWLRLLLLDYPEGPLRARWPRELWHEIRVDETSDGQAELVALISHHS